METEFVIENMENDPLDKAFERMKSMRVDDKSIKITIWDVDYFFYKKWKKWKYDWWGVNLQSH